MSTTEAPYYPTLPFARSLAFIVGIDKYQKVPQLRTAVNDAARVAQVLESEQHFEIKELLLNATRAQMMTLLTETLPNRVTAEDRVFFYFAGHGIADGSEGPEG